MPKPKKSNPEPEKEISEENRRLAEEFEKEIDSKLCDLGVDDEFDVLPVEQAQMGIERGNFTMEIPVGSDVKLGDISTSLKDRILSLEITMKNESSETTRQIGKMLTLPQNIDLNSLKYSLTSQGNFKVEAPYLIQPPVSNSSSGCPGDRSSETPSSVALQLHNQLRIEHGVAPLALNPDLSKVAETFAKAVTKGTQVNLDESSLGRNTFEISGISEVDAVREAVKTWYSQNKDFNWTDPADSPKNTFSFCEIVCKSTGFLGVGVVTNGENVAVVALYSRRGNLLTDPEKMKENVLPLLKNN